MVRILALTLILFLSAGCSAGRAPVPPGTIPQQTTVSAEDEQYGHDVLSSLTEQFPLDTDDSRINRVRDIADRLAMASGNDQSPWHVHVLKDDSVKNAAATRGNYLFVWSGMFKAVHNDTELATVIAHEMGHVLAGHTAASAQQEAAEILSGIMGVAAGSALSIQGYGGLSDIAQLMVENIFKAALLNPQSQADELEADQIGLFLMADAQYNPDEAVAFWKRVQSDPDFESASLAFFSTHPSTDERIVSISQHLDSARTRYQLALGHKVPSASLSSGGAGSQSPYQPPLNDKKQAPLPQAAIGTVERWMVASPNVHIYSDADSGSTIAGSIAEGEVVSGQLIKRRGVQVVTPTAGFIRSAELSPLK